MRGTLNTAWKRPWNSGIWRRPPRTHRDFHAGSLAVGSRSLPRSKQLTREGPMARYDNILQTIGNTPLVRLNKLAPAGVNVYVKVESFNPMGSVKGVMGAAVSR